MLPNVAKPLSCVIAGPVPFQRYVPDVMGCEVYVLPLWSGTGGLSKTRRDEVVPAEAVVEANDTLDIKVRTDKTKIRDMYSSITNEIEAFKNRKRKEKSDLKC